MSIENIDWNENKHQTCDLTGGMPMRDRICIRLTNGEESTPIFYGHWCGLRGLKIMNENVHEPANTMGGIMFNFVVKIMGGEPQRYSFDIWNDDEGETATTGTADSGRTI